MKTIKIFLIAFVVLSGFSGISQKYINKDNSTITKEWNGNSFLSSKTFYENIAESSDFTSLKKVLNNKELLNTLEKEEMITVFAITNNGFATYQQKQDSIFDVANANKLTAIIKYHVIPGRVDSHSIKKAIQRKNGTVYFATLQGDKLGFKEENGQLYLIDNQGNTSLITATDFFHKNGFFHIVDGIVFPNLD